jgi:hypothetical protein
MVQRFIFAARRSRITILISIFRIFPALKKWQRYVFHWFLSNDQSPYQVVDRCIYCGSTEQLSDEHIVPINLGGNRVLYKASCENCRLKIHPVETECLKQFRHIRYRLGIGKRNIKSRPTKVSVQVLVNWDGQEEVKPPGKNPNQKWEWNEISYAEHMTPLYLPRFKLPGLMRGLSPRKSARDYFAGHWFHNEPVESGAEPKLPMWIPGDIHYLLLARMLAKIAHGMAVWTFGLEGFEPYLTNFILGDDVSKAFYLVGGEPIPRPPHKTHLHLEISRGTIKGSNQKQIFAAIRLFADRFTRERPKLGGSPVYLVVVGKYLKN